MRIYCNAPSPLENARDPTQLIGCRRTPELCEVELRILAAVLALMMSFAAIGSAKAAELVMFEEAGCGWCARWNKEIGVVYANTDEGRIAPLRRVDIHDHRPDDLNEITAVSFSPTFVVFEDGKEYGRIVGYPGQDFFWPMLQSILSSLPAADGATAANLRMK